MADKTLSTIIGGGGKEIGDILFTIGDSLPDGKTLVACDGSIVTPASLPLLEALLPSAPMFGIPVQEDVGILKAKKFKFSQTNNKTVSVYGQISSNGFASWSDGITLTVDQSSTLRYNGCAISDDGVESMFMYMDNTDLKIKTNVTGDVPTDILLIDGVGVYSDSQSSFFGGCMMAADGGKAVVFGRIDSNKDLKIWTSGLDITTGYTLTSTITGLGNASYQVVSAHNATLTHFTIISSLGMMITTDSGATFSQIESVLPNGLVPGRIVYDSSDNMIASSTNAIYRSTDDGANWTEIAVGLDFVARYFDGSVVLPIILGINIDSSDNLYAQIKAAGLIGMLFSIDDGVTWDFNLQFESVNPMGTFLNKAGTKYWSLKVSGINVTVWTNTLTPITTSALGIIPGFKIVADAP